MLNLEQSGTTGLITGSQGFIATAFQSLIMGPYLAQCSF